MKFQIGDKAKFHLTGVIRTICDVRTRTQYLISIDGNKENGVWVSERNLEPLSAEPQMIRLGDAPIGALVRWNMLHIVVGTEDGGEVVNLISVGNSYADRRDANEPVELVALPGYDALALAKELEK